MVMSMAAYGTDLSLARLRELAVEAECDPRTVARALLGQPLRALRAKRACEAVLRRAGLLPAPAPDVVDIHAAPTES